MKPFISIIIPIYNVEKYLQHCLDTVLKQTYKNWEAIMVNDGSTDGSEKIAAGVAENDPRFRLVHRPNGGLSAARNTGLKHVTGDYVFFLDSDDYLDKDCIATLVAAAEAYNAEIVQANFYYDYPDYVLYNNHLNNKAVCMSRDEAVHELIKQEIIKNFAWGKLIRTDIAKKHRFPEGKYFEDTVWKYKVIRDCTQYVVIGRPMLYYLQRSAGISGAFSIRNADQVEGYGERLKLIEQDYPQFYSEALKRFNDLLLAYSRLINQLSTRDKAVFDSILHQWQVTFKLRKAFAKDWFIADHRMLDKMALLLRRIKNKIQGRGNWVRQSKQAGKSFSN